MLNIFGSSASTYPFYKTQIFFWRRTSFQWHCFGGGLVSKSCLTLATPWTVACQAPLSMEFSRQEYWSWVPFTSTGDLPNPGIKPRSAALQADSLPSQPSRTPPNEVGPALKGKEQLHSEERQWRKQQKCEQRQSSESVIHWRGSWWGVVISPTPTTRNIWQLLETFLIVTTWGERGYYWHLVGRGQRCC